MAILNIYNNDIIDFDHVTFFRLINLFFTVVYIMFGTDLARKGWADQHPKSCWGTTAPVEGWWVQYLPQGALQAQGGWFPGRASWTWFLEKLETASWLQFYNTAVIIIWVGGIGITP